MRVYSACFARLLPIVILIPCGCRVNNRPAIEKKPPLVRRGEAPGIPPSDSFPPPPKLPRVPARRERTFAAHADRLIFSPDGKCLLTGNKGRLTLWSASGEKRRSFGSAPNAPFFQGTGSLAFSQDGRLLATGGRRIQLRDGVTGRVLRSLYTPEEEEGDLRAAFSPDGRLLAGEVQDVFNELRVWRLPRGRLLRVRKAGSDPDSGLRLPVFSPDGRYLAAGQEETLHTEPQSSYLSVRLYDTRTWRVTRTFALEQTHGGFQSMVFSPDGKYLAATFTTWSTDTDLVLVDVRDGKRTNLAMAFPGDNLHFSPDGQWLATIVDVRGLWFWNLKKRRAEMLPLPDVGIRAFAFSPEGKLLAVARGDEKIQIWRLPD